MSFLNMIDYIIFDKNTRLEEYSPVQEGIDSLEVWINIKVDLLVMKNHPELLEESLLQYI